MQKVASTLPALLLTGAADAPAIGAPGRTALSFADLRDLAGRTRDAFAAAGIGGNARVAIVLPNGAEMAACFLAVASCAAAAPLNPGYTADEFDFYLADLRAVALIIQAGMASPVRDVAAKRGVAIIELVTGRQAGAFTLEFPSVPPGPPVQPARVEEDAIALILHTSGTTARPKIVPLSQKNLVVSAQNIGRTLLLTPEDCCLNIMPLFHIHGLMAAVLASVAAGASVVCSPGFDGFRFFSWFEKVRPTWYTAVPTMHQTILALAPRFQAIVDAGRLRFIRSSSASLPPAVMTALEQAFHVPVIEAYGMTEAAHQMASNQLPPAPRYPGCVGVAAGPEIAIMDEVGYLLPPGTAGEVVIRGGNVIAGYEGNPEANAKSFTWGWFRTGDQGILGEDGYLRLTGRIKEIINRAGEKIHPLEVDHAMMQHEAVQQAVTFGVPNKLLGEAVAAAIVLHEGAMLEAEGLRDFLIGRIAPFKVPQQFIFVDKIPKGATGKIQRIGLASQLGLVS